MFFPRVRGPQYGRDAAAESGTSGTGAPRRLILAGAAVGAVVGLAALNLRFILGSGGRWLRPDNDFNAYLVAWHYFVLDRWRFPLFSVPAMGYPEGGSVLFNDALPLTAVLTKLLFRTSGVLVNPFGWWILLTYILQGAMAARVVRALGARSVLAAVAAATFAVCCQPFMYRWIHTALSSHFLVLWALALYFESAERGRVPMAELFLVGVIALLVNSYLFVTVALLGAATAFERWIHVWPTRREMAWVGLTVVTLVAIGIASGYGVMITNPTAMKSGGFGLYSWNPISLLVPPAPLWGVPRTFVRDATGGQYEGDSFIGLGAVLLLLAVVATRPRVLLQAARRHPVFVLTLIGFGVWAASNRVYIGSILLFKIGLPPGLMDAANYFRASGRFIWPLFYTVMLVPVALVHRHWRPAIAVPVTVVAIALQIVEARPTIRKTQVATTRAPADLIESARLTPWMLSHQRVWQYPSWACGGLTGLPLVWGGNSANRELQLELLAARLDRPSNSVYTSRVLKDCEIEEAWGREPPQLETGVLYLLAPTVKTTTPALAPLIGSSSCVDLNWVIACSSSWPAAATAVGSSGRDP